MLSAVVGCIVCGVHVLSMPTVADGDAVADGDVLTIDDVSDCRMK